MGVLQLSGFYSHLFNRVVLWLFGVSSQLLMTKYTWRVVTPLFLYLCFAWYWRKWPEFIAGSLKVNHEPLIFKIRQLGLGGAFLSILIKFLTDRVQRVVVDGHYSAWRNVISGVPQGSVLGPLLFILYTHDMWFGLENMLVAYADDGTLLAVVPSPDMRSVISDSLSRNWAKIIEWCRLWCMKMNPSKIQSKIIIRSRILQPQHPNIFSENVPFTICN